MEEKELELRLTRTELATVKRINKSVLTFRKKREKAIEVIKAKQAEIEEYNSIIDSFEAPIILMTRGYNSEQVLDGTMEREQLLKLTDVSPEDSIDDRIELNNLSTLDGAPVLESEPDEDDFMATFIAEVSK